MEKDKIIEELRSENQRYKNFIRSLGYSEDMISCRKLSKKEKIDIFFDYFSGRKDVYAEKYFNKGKNKYMYSPSCYNKFKEGICPKKASYRDVDKKVYTCGKCMNRLNKPYDKVVLEEHFIKSNKAIGIYPLFEEDMCKLLAIDFDDDNWFSDMLSVYYVAKKYHFASIMERSASGNGGHLWFFFKAPMKASKARRFGDFLITEARKQNKNILFDSYDRMFPNQDYISDDGYGNLIALPYQFDYVKYNNTVFIDENGNQIMQPMEYLSGIMKIEESEIDCIIKGDVLKEYFDDSEQSVLPLGASDKYSSIIEGIESSMLCIQKHNLNANTIQTLRRLGSIQNPKYNELLRLHKFIDPSKVSRIRCEYMETDELLYLPRGLKSRLAQTFINSKLNIRDNTQKGHPIDVEFKEGQSLRDEQKPIVKALLKDNMGLLVANTAYGKTVMALYLIAKLKVNTLVIVNKKELLNQWQERMEMFLNFPQSKLKRDYYIGNYYGTKKRLKGNLDIATIQSLSNSDNIGELVSTYGMVIIDECHHAASDTYISVLREIKAHYIYGLTATPDRKDKLDKVMYMYCGPKLYETSYTQVLRKRTFKQILVPRYTVVTLVKDTDNFQDICNELVEIEARNFMIALDIIKEIKANKNILVLSDRTKHLDNLYNKVRDTGVPMYVLTGKTSKKDRKAISDQLKANIVAEMNFVLFSTSSIVGEGFDLPALDTLFLTLPFSDKNRVSQYAGRLHREYQGKDIVRIFDYVDLHVTYLESMYKKRLTQFFKEGYYIETEDRLYERDETVIGDTEFYHMIWSDIANAKKSIVFMNNKVTLSVLKKEQDKLRAKAYQGVIMKMYLNESIKEESATNAYLKGVGIKVISTKLQQYYIVIDSNIVWICNDDLFSAKRNVNNTSLRLTDYKLAQQLLILYEEKNESEGLFALE